ncbi:MAG: glycosyltransferase family 2 protein [Nanoarchaeota archaeon]|nr:glycosyltransferase family 2 protein [Nanoarchaeota archaeon]
MTRKQKVIIVMPAYNAAKTLEKTYKAIPKKSYDNIILVDDCSKDNTVEIAKKLGLKVIVHEKNKGYGANQKTCYNTALGKGGDIIVMLHPDFQYDPTLVPEMVKPIKEGKADVVYGSRMLIRGMAMKGRMPFWKRAGNFLLTIYMNIMLGTEFTDSATGYIAYSKKVLKSIPFMYNHDGYCFDEEVIIQCAKRKFKMVEVPIPTRYEYDSSSIKFKKAVKYGVTLFSEIFLYKLQQLHLINLKKFK